MASRTQIALLALALASVAALVYANSLDVPFFFDDRAHIVEDRRIEQLWPPWLLLEASYRPVLRLSLALNYALGGREVAGYHAVNLVIHVLAALALFGVVRRSAGRAAPGWPAARCTAFAFLAALLWLVHPLQTQSVTYTIQRGESLAGLFYLLTLYAAIRCADSQRSLLWSCVSIASCALGMGAKSVMVTAPLAVLLYDRTFLAGSVRGALARRWPLYFGLVASWGILFSVVGLRFLGTDQNAGFGLAVVSPAEYLASQPGVMLHYLRLAIWPHPLCFDYDWPIARSWQAILLPALLVGGLLAGATAGLLRGRWWGCVGFLFFLVLAPTSSIMPIADLAVEHRMYLPLAAVVVLVLAAGFRLLGGRGRRARAVGLSVALAAALALALTSVRRNDVYRDTVRLWYEVTLQRPSNPRAHLNLGVALAERGKHEEALESFRTALALRPDHAVTQQDLANELLAVGRPELAIPHYEAALELNPGSGRTHSNLGVALRRVGRLEDSRRHHLEGVRRAPRSPKAHLTLGHTLLAVDDQDGAARAYLRALALDPDYAKAHRSLANLQRETGAVAEAVAHYRQATHFEPSAWGSHNDLAWLLATHPGLPRQLPREAVIHAEHAVALTGGERATVLDTLAVAQASVGDYAAAAATAARALARARAEAAPELAAEIEARRAHFARGEAWPAGEIP